MSVDLLFYLVFLSQILLISYYYPRKILTRISYVLKHYPASEYPRLYPESPDKVRSGQQVFRILNLVILAIGVMLIIGYAVLSREYSDIAQRFENMPLLYGMLQFTPLVLLEITGFKQFKLMRNADHRTCKKAELAPRRLFDYISPRLLATAVTMFFVYLGYDLYLNQFNWTEDLIIKLFALLACNGLFVFLTLKNLRGKKQDPYQANKDRSKQIEFATKSMAYVSILVSVFMIAVTTVNNLQLEYLDIYLYSIYFQLVAILGCGSVLNSIRVKDIDFNVYKKERKPAH